MPLSNFVPDDYETQLQAKLSGIRPAFLPLCPAQLLGAADIIRSAPTHYRRRAEFRMWHSGERVDFVMFRPEQPKTPHKIERFPVASRYISERMPALKAQLDACSVLRRKLFQAEFLTTATDDTLVTLIYHRILDDAWRQAAAELAAVLGVKIIGRSRGQRLVVTDDVVTEELSISGRSYRYRQGEGVFTQPNGDVNRQMIEWVLGQLAPDDGDLLELYCGIGNFTLPLAQRFRRVLATEISRQAVALARDNQRANEIDNLTLLRISSEDFTQALQRVRPFRRLAAINLDDFLLHTILVDPPRAGLDDRTLALVKKFPQIIYISCNPTTLLGNLQALQQTHHIHRLGFFDQFPYTPHLECGVILRAKNIRS